MWPRHSARSQRSHLPPGAKCLEANCFPWRMVTRGGRPNRCAVGRWARRGESPASPFLTPRSAQKADQMTKITVHRFSVYDVQTDENVVSRRMATLEAITRARGEAIKGTAFEIDAADLDPDLDGMTRRGFLPRAEPLGFQRVVSV